MQEGKGPHMSVWISSNNSISAITPLAWKNRLDNHIEVELLDLHDRCHARQAVVDNAVNRWSLALQEKISTLSTEVKEHKVTSLETENERLEAIEVSLRKEVEELKHDRREMVSKAVPYAAMELVYSDDMGSLVGRLVSSAILYVRCRAYEQVADMKDLSTCRRQRVIILLTRKIILRLAMILPLLLSLGWMSSWQIPQLLLKLYCRRSLYLFKDLLLQGLKSPWLLLKELLHPRFQSLTRCKYPMPTMKVGFYGEHSLQSYLRIWRTLSLTSLCASSSQGSCVVVLNL
nr:hypothetical protein [Tanacetum cinerariifolium]